MRKLLFLVLAITASVAFASPPVQEEKLPDPALKLPEEITEPTEEHTEAEETQREPEETQREPEETQREPEETQREPEETQREPEETQEETQGMLEEPVLEEDYLIEETPETELETELEINAIQTDRNIVPVEEAVAELEPETNKTNKTRFALWSCKGAVIQGNCYQYFRTKLNGNQAEFHCNSICHKGHLASVTSSHIRDEIGRLMDRNGGWSRAWLGGRRILRTKRFRWLGGAPWTYNNWAKGEPNNLGLRENCVETWYNLAFNDVRCTIQKPFVCSCPL